jgi:hypothetical protein
VVISLRQNLIFLVSVLLMTSNIYADNNYQNKFEQSKNSTIIIDSVSSVQGAIAQSQCNLTFVAGSTGHVDIRNSSFVTAFNIQPNIPVGSNITVLSNGCTASLAPSASCRITFTSAVAEGPTTIPITGNNTNLVNAIVTVSPAAPLTTLSISRAEIALATQGILTDASGAGTQPSQPRTLTITNTGATVADNVMYTITPSLPAGTTIAPANCGNIAPGASCTLTITPGATPSSPADQVPAPSTINVAGINTPTPVSSDIIILTYGNRYKSGFIFAIDDSTNQAISVGGKVAALIDQEPPAFPNGIVWSPFDAFVPEPCAKFTDGACNTQEIVNFYTPPTSLSDYAAGLCKAVISGLNDWYLPAICEQGHSLATGECGNIAVPNIQNIQSNLVDNAQGSIGGLNGSYWSSVQAPPPANPFTTSLFQDFFIGGGFQSRTSKSAQLGVRCVRQII